MLKTEYVGQSNRRQVNWAGKAVLYYSLTQLPDSDHCVNLRRRKKKKKKKKQ